MHKTRLADDLVGVETGAADLQGSPWRKAGMMACLPGFCGG